MTEQRYLKIMNSKEFVKQVFELVWHQGASVEHYGEGLKELPGRDNHYTYEATLGKIKVSINTLKTKNINNKSIHNIYGYPVDD